MLTMFQHVHWRKYIHIQDLKMALQACLLAIALEAANMATAPACNICSCCHMAIAIGQFDGLVMKNPLTLLQAHVRPLQQDQR